MGTMLQIKPMLYLDEKGKPEVIGTPRDRKKVYINLVTCMVQSWAPELGKSVLVVHRACPEYTLIPACWY